jgi:aminoglycoside phosphotransferase (APT) family kinase protein
MATTPRPIIDSVVRSVCGREVERVVRLTSGGVNETYRVELPNDVAVVVRIARQPVPWFTDEEHVMAQARGVGVPTAEVLGVEQVDHDGELLSFSILRLVPGRSLDELVGELSASELERFVMDGGELLARCTASCRTAASGTSSNRPTKPSSCARCGSPTTCSVRRGLRSSSAVLTFSVTR